MKTFILAVTILTLAFVNLVLVEVTGLRCWYDHVNKTKCDPVRRRRVVYLKLRKGMPAGCPKTRVESWPCRGLRQKLHPEYRKNSTCIYVAGGRTSCNPITKTRNVSLTLIEGNHAVCKLTKVHKQSCVVPPAGRTGRRCRYTIVSHTNCNNGAKWFTITLKLRKGKRRYCQEMILENRTCTGYIRPDNIPPLGHLSGGKGSACTYIIIHTTPCDNKTHTFTEVMRLKSGNRSICSPAKVIHKPCAKHPVKNSGDKCQYTTVHRTSCKNGAKTFTVNLKLVKGNRSICVDWVIQKRKCEDYMEPINVTPLGPFSGGKGTPCDYVSVHRSSCDKTSHRLTEILKLKHGNKSQCAPIKVVSKLCSIAPHPYKLQLHHYENITKDETKLTSDNCQYAVVRQLPCNKFTHHRKILFKLIKGDKSCSHMKMGMRPCADISHCKYQRIASKCVNNKRTINYKVIAGGTECPHKVSSREPCEHTDKRKAHNNQKTVELI